MIYYYIPDFFWHYNVNVRLLELIQQYPIMFYDDFKIGAVFGNFPNCIWNGGGITLGRYVSSEEQKSISATFNAFGVPLRLTMTNLLVEDSDCLDRYANYIMENLNNGFNQVLVASPILEKYIREKYPEYPIVKSILAAEHQFYDDSDKYFMSVLKKHKNDDIEFLQSIQNKDKIEMLANETCNENCPRAYTHYLDFAQQQLYQECKNDLIIDCSYNRDFCFLKAKNSHLTISREQIKEIYEPMGFKHFKLSGRGAHGSIVVDYANYMVKPE